MPEQTVTQNETEQTATQNETEVVQQIGELLKPEEKSEQVEEKEGVQTSESQESKEVQEESQETTQETSQEQPKIIDDEFIERHPKLKMYRGKPIESIADGYEKLVETLNKQSAEINKLKQKKLSDSVPKPEEVPDPVEKPEEFKKWLKDYTTQIREDERSQLASQPEQPDIVGEVQRRLPEGADVQKVIDGWIRFNSARIFNEFGERRPEITDFYNQNPEVLFTEITEYYTLANQAQKNEMQIKTEGKNLAYQNVKDALKKGNANKENLPNAEVNAISRSQGVLTPSEELLMKIRSKLPQEG